MKHRRLPRIAEAALLVYSMHDFRKADSIPGNNPYDTFNYGEFAIIRN